MNREIKNLVGFGFISAVALWSANKGYKKGFSRGRRFEKMANDYEEKIKKDFTDRSYKENTGR